MCNLPVPKPITAKNKISLDLKEKKGYTAEILVKKSENTVLHLISIKSVIFKRNNPVVETHQNIIYLS
jgi:hypothetical protein